MQWKELDEVVRTTSVIAGPPARPRRLPAGAWLAGIALLALAGAGAFAGERQLQALMTELDGKSLERAGLLLGRTIEQQKGYLVAEARLLAGDTRVRTTVMTPQFNETTVRDVLEDLRSASGANVMAVIDVRGKVQAASGGEGLRSMDLGGSPLVSQALEKPAAQVWTLPDQVLLVGVAPVRSGGQVVALFLIGYELREAALSPIAKTLGVEGAVVIRDKIVAASSPVPAVAETVRAALALEEGVNHVVNDGVPHLAHVSRISDSAGAGRVVWMMPMHQHGSRVTKLQVLSFLPILLVGLSLGLAVALFSRGAQAAMPSSPERT